MAVAPGRIPGLAMTEIGFEWADLEAFDDREVHEDLSLVK